MLGPSFGAALVVCGEENHGQSFGAPGVVWIFNEVGGLIDQPVKNPHEP